MTDASTVRIVIVSLAVVTVTGLLSVVWLVDHAADPASIAIVASFGSTALGALAGVLVSTRTQADPPDPAVRQAIGAAVNQAQQVGAARVEAAVIAVAAHPELVDE